MSEDLGSSASARKSRDIIFVGRMGTSIVNLYRSPCDMQTATVHFVFDFSKHLTQFLLAPNQTLIFTSMAGTSLHFPNHPGTTNPGRNILCYVFIHHRLLFHFSWPGFWGWSTGRNVRNRKISRFEGINK